MADSFDWNALQSFLAVARAGRLTVAARQLGVDHSTLSRRIVALEEALQAQLFDRRTNGYILTSQGERLLESAQAMESVALTVLSAHDSDATAKPLFGRRPHTSGRNPHGSRAV